MTMRLFVLIGLLGTVVARGPADAKHKQEHDADKADVVVYGATASGVIAAVAAAREGKSVILLEPGKHVGGMVSGGLGATDTGNRAAIGGHSREFFTRVRDYYVKKYGAKSDQVKDCSDGFRFEPHVAELIFNEMLKEAKVRVVFGRRLASVHRTGGRITGITCDTPGKEGTHRYDGAVFIDAGYEGDLMAKARVDFKVGREPRQQYDESLAGVQKHSAAHQWPVKVSGFGPGKRVLPFIQAYPLAEPGAGDNKTQAYNFRLCMTQRPDLRLSWPKPANYEPANYELLARYLAKRPDVKVGQLMNPVKVPNGKTDTNNNGPFSTDYIGENWGYPEGDYESRGHIWKEHEDYTKGLFYFLANDPRVPKKLQEEINTWGLSKGEFVDTDNWPHQLYVREARRMLGEYVMTQADIMEKRTKEDSVGLGSYNTDSHHVQRVVGPDGFVLNEGDFQVGVQPYAIPYRSLVPKSAQCENLLVPVCCSASHVGYGTIRMEPVYMILGQASGVAASLAADEKTSVQKVSIAKLQARLKVQRAVLSPAGLSGAGATGKVYDPAKLPGIVVDDAMAEKVGNWVHSRSTSPFVGDGYLHDTNTDRGKSRVRFTPKLPKDGKYEVRVFYSPYANRATNALVMVHTSDGDREFRINQRQTPKDGAQSLGAFHFPAAGGYVEIRNDGADGFVIADAVQWLPSP